MKVPEAFEKYHHENVLLLQLQNPWIVARCKAILAWIDTGLEGHQV